MLVGCFDCLSPANTDWPTYAFLEFDGGDSIVGLKDKSKSVLWDAEWFSELSSIKRDCSSMLVSLSLVVVVATVADAPGGLNCNFRLLDAKFGGAIFESTDAGGNRLVGGDDFKGERDLASLFESLRRLCGLSGCKHDVSSSSSLNFSRIKAEVCSSIIESYSPLIKFSSLVINTSSV